MILDYFYGQAGELFSFYRIPKALFQEPRFQSLSTDAKTLYGILLDRMSLSVKNGWLDEQNRVFVIYTHRGCQEGVVLQEPTKRTRVCSAELRKAWYGILNWTRMSLSGKANGWLDEQNFSAESFKINLHDRGCQEGVVLRRQQSDQAAPGTRKVWSD